MCASEWHFRSLADYYKATSSNKHATCGPDLIRQARVSESIKTSKRQHYSVVLFKNNVCYIKARCGCCSFCKKNHSWILKIVDLCIFIYYIGDEKNSGPRVWNILHL